jgi:preprotein translocase SecE subunit
MAKSRAQRKAERRAREERDAARSGDGQPSDSTAQHDTQVPVSGEVAEIEAVEAGIAAGAPEKSLETPDTPKKTSRAEKRAEARETKERDKRKKDEQKRRERDQLAKKQKQAQADRQRGGVVGFIASCWAELKKVQWPDRDTPVQATAVTIIFVTVAAAYLGALDAVFNFLVKQIL